MIVGHVLFVTMETTASFLKLRALLKKPLILLDAPFDEHRTWKSRVIYGFALAASLVGSAAAAWLFLTWILVGLPQTIVTDTLGTRCLSESGIDCARAIADARQAVLFSAGGLIAIVGLYFTYRRWMLEHENTNIAAAEGRVVEERHSREGEQLEITRITDALSLLESNDRTKKVAAISLLSDYAIHASEDRHARLVLDVLLDVVKHGTLDSAQVDVPGMDATYSGLDRMDDLTRLALRGLLRASNRRGLRTDLTNRVFVGFNGQGTSWETADISRSLFIRCDLQRANFGSGGHVYGVLFNDSQLTGATFKNCVLEFVRFRSNSVPPRRLVSMDAAVFEGVTCMAVEFANMSATEVRFESSSLRTVTFPGTLITGVRMRGCAIHEVALNRAELGNLGVQIIDAEKIEGLHVGDNGNRVFVASSASRDSGETPGDSRTPIRT